MINHIDLKHISAIYACPLCKHVNRTEDSRKRHILRSHKLHLSLKNIRDGNIPTLEYT